MNDPPRPRHTRHFYVACLLARAAAFLFLVRYALIDPAALQADLLPAHSTSPR